MLRVHFGRYAKGSAAIFSISYLGGERDKDVHEDVIHLMRSGKGCRALTSCSGSLAGCIFRLPNGRHMQRVKPEHASAHTARA